MVYITATLTRAKLRHEFNVMSGLLKGLKKQSRNRAVTTWSWMPGRLERRVESNIHAYPISSVVGNAVRAGHISTCGRPRALFRRDGDQHLRQAINTFFH